jgi:hypothetical protein
MYELSPTGERKKVRHRNHDTDLGPKIKILAVEIEDSRTTVPKSPAISAPTPWITAEEE